jgi:Saxitoxin biosynthesis operon protein SxtJ
MLKPIWYPDQKQLRQFAVAALVAFGALGALAWYKAGSTRGAIALWAVGIVALLLGVLSPAALRPVYMILMAAAYPIGWLVSNLLLRVIFYGIFMPLGLSFRILRRDVLTLGRPQAESYWRELRRPKDVTSYYRQA